MTPANGTIRSIADVGADLGFRLDELEVHGDGRAKLDLPIQQQLDGHPDHDVRVPPGRLVLVTATSPTRAGEGKSVTTIGLSMALNRLGRRAVCTLRQSSLGPTLGLKGGGAGGGNAAIMPIEQALLGLGADLFAVESANNLLAAAVDDRIGLPTDSSSIDAESIWWRRVIDMDDRALRYVDVRPDGSPTGTVRPTGFDITAASEVMAVMSLATDLVDLRDRLARIVVGFDTAGEPVTAEHLSATGAMAVLLRDAFRPNLLQTSEGTPAIIHGGPFANIAHGCSSIVADRSVIHRTDYVVTEAGFGADLGAEKFLHLKCGAGGTIPDVVVLVTTVKALAEHGRHLGSSGPTDRDVMVGSVNLDRHVRNLVLFGIPVVVAINSFPDDTEASYRVIEAAARTAGAADVVTHSAFTEGGRGCESLADAVERASALPNAYRRLYSPGTTVAESVDLLATTLYGASGVTWSSAASQRMQRLNDAGFGTLPVCIAKTPSSFSHDPQLAGAPTGYEFPVTDVRLQAGAGFVTVYAGDIMTMPGLPRRPKFIDIGLDAAGEIFGLT